ncbi:MAG: sugar ABC transporter permease [Lachnospiraceae bacterium]|nr:sugar ABC transporter permease [Candidatus Minthocola equi]
MKKTITAKQAAFFLPLFLLLAVFAIYPIVTSVVYSFFDYRTNDQTAAGLYTGSNFNAPLFYEDCDYVNWYLEDELTVLPEADAAEMSGIMDEIDAIAAPYKDATAAIEMDEEEAKAIIDKVSDIRARLTAIFERNPDAPFYNGLETQNALFDEINGCVISSNFQGLEAYKQLLHDTRFGKSLVSTLVFTVISVFFELVLGMALALIMNKAIKGIGIVRTTALIPWAIPTAVSALMWSYMYDGSSGIIAKLFADIGLIAAPEQMLLSAEGAMTAAILADVWKTTPYMALLLLAGLQIIDNGLYESAKVDGAGPISTFFSITLPLLKPSMLVALLFRTLDAFRVYDLIAVLTGGAQGTETLSIYAYKLMIGQSNYGYGSAVVLAMAVCVAIIAFLFVKVLGAELINDD